MEEHQRQGSGSRRAAIEDNRGIDDQWDRALGYDTSGNSSGRTTGFECTTEIDHRGSTTGIQVEATAAITNATPLPIEEEKDADVWAVPEDSPVDPEAERKRHALLRVVRLREKGLPDYRAYLADYCEREVNKPSEDVD